MPPIKVYMFYTVYFLHYWDLYAVNINAIFGHIWHKFLLNYVYSSAFCFLREAMKRTLRYEVQRSLGYNKMKEIKGGFSRAR